MSALPLTIVMSQLRQGSLVRLDVQGWPLRRDLLVVRHTDKYVFRALAAFLQTVTAELHAERAP